jgi:hypothetical protein
MDLRKKLQIAFDAAFSVAQERGMSFDEAKQFISEFLLRYRDPDVYFFQQQDNQVRKDVN